MAGQVTGTKVLVMKMVIAVPPDVQPEQMQQAVLNGVSVSAAVQQFVRVMDLTVQDDVVTGPRLS